MKKWMNTYKEEIAIGIISIIAFVVGILSVGFLKAFLIIGVADIIYIGSIVMKKKNKKTIKSKTKNEKTNKNKKKTWIKILKGIIIFGLICFILLMIAAVIFWSKIVKNAPEFKESNLYRSESTIIYRNDGVIVGKLGAEKREKITYDQLPEVLVNAIVATEDSRFFEHNGFDLPRFLVASVKQVLGQGGGGASTLTMQVAKNNFTDTTQSIERKFTDIYLSIFQIEQRYTKQEIMEFYVNSNYLGSGAYGVEQACLNYFGKSAKDINLSEAAMIAGLFQSPDSYDPSINPEATESRRKTVLYLMRRHGYITEEEYNIALKLTVDKIVVGNSTSKDTGDYRAFIDTVVEEVVKDTGLDPYTTPMEIYTTLDTERQDVINGIMNGETFKWENDVVQAGISVIDVKTGAIVAVGAGRNRTGERQYNFATMIKKQIGSTSKPLFDYAPGIEYQNWSTYTPFTDEEHSYSNGGSMSNWDRKFGNTITGETFMTLRTALAQSRNIPALKAFQANQNSDIYNFVTSLGLSPELSSGTLIHEAHAIGGYTGESPLTLSAAYAAFSNGGYYITPHSYTKIVFRDTNKTYEKQINKTRVMSEETAYMMTSLLQSSAQYGLGAQSYINGAVYGAKTGTSNYADATIKAKGYPSNAVNDLWVAGISPDYSIAVWYGYKENYDNYTSTTNTISHRKIFQTAAKGIFNKGSNWTKPNGVVEVEIEYGSYPAALPSEYTPAKERVTELFKSGTEPTEVSKKYSKLDNVTDLKGTVSGNTLTLTWKGIDTPYPINESLIDQYVTSLYGSEKFRNNAKNQILSTNKSTFGSLVYKIYSKDLTGKLTLVKTTNETSTTIENITSSSLKTYVVKSSYTNYTANASDGTEVTIDLSGIKEEITAVLKGENSIQLKINEKYNEQGVTVKKDSKEIKLEDKNLKITIQNEKKETVTKVDTSKEGTYTITYNISYEKFTKTLTRKVTIIKG